MTIDEKKAEIADVEGWIEDLKELPFDTSGDLVNARRFLAILRDDLKKMEKGENNGI